MCCRLWVVFLISFLLAGAVPVRAAPFDECLQTFTVCCSRTIVATAEHVFLRMWALMPVVAEITPPTTYQCHGGHLSIRSPIPAPRHPAENVECYQGSRPLRPVGNVLYAGLAAPYDREQGHLMIWLPEHRYRWAGGGCIG